jgi:SAM-dependent methyltransferase
LIEKEIMGLEYLKPKERFTKRVENYVKYRPGYPDEIIAYLEKRAVLNKKCRIADIGSGTGKLSELFLSRGYKVYAVEPNAEMRQAAEKIFKGNKYFVSLNGSAEAVPLEDGSVDIIIVGQAFHWFEAETAVKEFKRILRNSGCVVLIWNNRDVTAGAFMRDYEQLLRQYGNDYKQIRSIYYGAKEMKKLFKSDFVEQAVFDYGQTLDFSGLKGRLQSTSYCPLPGSRGYIIIINKLRELFKKHARDNNVKIKYKTEVYVIRIMKGRYNNDRSRDIPA